MAVRYVERFQTTEARLLRFLKQKLRERGWEEGLPAPDLAAIAARMVQLGYVNDEAFAGARTRSLTRRGMGAGRVRAALKAHGVHEALVESALEEVDERAAAVDFARRKRIGPFGMRSEDWPKQRAKQLAAMARAGHGFDLARRVVDAESEDQLDW